MAYTGIRPRGSDSDSDETSRGRDTWRNAHGQEAQDRARPADLTLADRENPRWRGNKDPQGRPSGQGWIHPPPNAGTSRRDPRCSRGALRDITVGVAMTPAAPDHTSSTSAEGGEPTEEPMSPAGGEGRGCEADAYHLQTQ